MHHDNLIVLGSIGVIGCLGNDFGIRIFKNNFGLRALLGGPTVASLVVVGLETVTFWSVAQSFNN